VQFSSNNIKDSSASWVVAASSYVQVSTWESGSSQMAPCAWPCIWVHHAGHQLSARTQNHARTAVHAHDNLASYRHGRSLSPSRRRTQALATAATHLSLSAADGRASCTRGLRSRRPVAWLTGVGSESRLCAWLAGVGAGSCLRA